MCKKYALIKDIKQLHPLLRQHVDAVNELYSLFDVTNIFEHTLADIGGYKFINAAHCDFSDDTEAKTASVTADVRNNVSSRVAFSGSITGVSNPAGVLKIGDIRLAVWNEFYNAMDYFYLPTWVWQPLCSQGGPDTLYKKGKVRIGFNSKKMEYRFSSANALYDMNQFKCNDIQDLAAMSPVMFRQMYDVNYGLL